jgi:hypothetical protein
MSVPPNTTQPLAPSTEPCAACGTPLADDQRYCLQCGEAREGARRPLPALLHGEVHGREASVAANAAGGEERRPSLAAALAGIACLLLAMGVGVLIGRGGGGNAAAPGPITITGSPAAAAAPAAAATTFTSDWPARRDGWTVALSVLPKDATQPGAVVAAKTQATGKGAPAVGALDSDGYRSLTAGSYVVYSGIFDAKRAATAALSPLKASFAGARVVHVAATGSAPSSSSSPSRASSKGRSSSSKTSRSTSGTSDTKKAFEQSKKAPKTVGTGGKPPPKDNKAAGGGGAFQEIK